MIPNVIHILEAIRFQALAVAINAPLAPSLAVNFPDPSIIHINNSWYSLGTTSGGINVQIARSQNFRQWNLLPKDALSRLPTWVNSRSPQIWAPDVVQRDDGQYVLYFSASVAQFPDKHCVGVATSQSVEGPYAPLERPFVCPDPIGRGAQINAIVSSPGMGGAIDASGFRDVDGSRYVVYKVDGNSLAKGGPCGNGESGRKPTPIMMVKVAGDGITPQGQPIQLLDRFDIDGPLIESPNLKRMKDGSYALLFSSNCWNSPLYDIAWARSQRITGPYQRQPLILKTGMAGLTAPGGASVSDDGTHMVFHANHAGGRAMFTATISEPGMVLQFSA